MRRLHLMSLALLVVLSGSPTSQAHMRAGPNKPAVADQTPPPRRAETDVPASPSIAQAFGGPDKYGYTWSDSEPSAWVDTGAALESELVGDDTASEAIEIGFPFKHYDGSYTHLYIGTNGIISFEQPIYQLNNMPVPSVDSVNNFIAPFWDDLVVGEAYSSGRVFILRGGSEPQRFIVIEWRNVRRYGATDTLTFQAILYENGDITIQYGLMTGDLQSATVGIEDSTNYDGLQYRHNTAGIRSNLRVQFTRPAPAARINSWPVSQGRLAAVGEAVAFQISLRNTGDFGPDRFALIPTSPWPVTFYAADGDTPLGDSDGDGHVDTGVFAPALTRAIVARVQVPLDTPAGTAAQPAILVRSALNMAVSNELRLQVAVPSPFAQVLRDDADGAISLHLAQPGGQSTVKVTPDGYNASEMAVAETAAGNLLVVWRKSRCLDEPTCNAYGSEIEYAVVDRRGQIIRPAGRLTNHTGATTSINDHTPVVAVAPNGQIGVLWASYLWDSATQQSSYNIFFAIRGPLGEPEFGPVNLTNNQIWGTSQDLHIPMFAAPRIAATADNRFVLSWSRMHQELGGPVDDIYFSVLSNTGVTIRGLTNLTNDAPGGERFFDPALRAIAGNRALLSWHRRVEGDDDILYAAVNSTGQIVRGISDLSVDESVIEWGNYDLLQLADGKVLAAWGAFGCFPDEWVWRIRYAILDAELNRVGPPRCLDNIALAPGGDIGVTMAATPAGGALLTWMQEGAFNHLYYAQLDSAGEVTTPPTIFHSSRAAYPFIVTSHEGYGVTTYSATGEGAVRGVVRDEAGTAITGVTVADNAGHTASTDANGIYTFIGLPAGTYTLTPARAGYRFSPASHLVTLPGASGAYDFTATRIVHSLSGQIVGPNNTPLAGVTVTNGMGQTVLTGADGAYRFTGLAPGNYTLTPSKEGLSFSPPSRSITLQSDLAGQDFAQMSRATWTFMLYMAGDTRALDSGTVYDAFTAAVRRLEQPGSANVQVVALIDGYNNNDSFRVTFTPQAQYLPLGEKRMDDPATLIEFVQQAQRDFPADHYYLAIADHANGVQGIAWDTTTDPQRRALLTPAEVRQALAAVTANGARPIDVLHFDGCSFGLLENASISSGLARYVVASQNIGWGVFLYNGYRDAVTTTTSPAALARSVADLYARRVEEQQYPYTISVLDMSRLPAVVTALDEFANGLTSFANVNQTNRDLITSLRTQSQKFDSGGRAEEYLMITNDDVYVDIVDFAARARQQVNAYGVPAAADRLITAITGGEQPFVLYEAHRSGSFTFVDLPRSWALDGAHGISIYFPPKRAGVVYGDYVSGALFPEFTAESGWKAFLQAGLAPLAPGEDGPAGALEPLAPLLPPDRHALFLPAVRR